MTYHAAIRQQRAAQAYLDNVAPDEDCPIYEEVDHEFRHDAARIAEAADDMSQCLDFDPVPLLVVMHELHTTQPTELASSGLLSRLYEAAKGPGKYINEWLESAIEAEVQRRKDENAEARECRHD